MKEKIKNLKAQNSLDVETTQDLEENIENKCK